MARLATLADYKDKVPSEDDDASKRQSYYAGGAGDGGRYEQQPCTRELAWLRSQTNILVPTRPITHNCRHTLHTTTAEQACTAAKAQRVVQ